jgi:hypothetical protein
VSKGSQKFPYIRLWGKSLGSMDYYIIGQVARANETNAPRDALYERYTERGKTGEWCCLSDLGPDHPFRDKCKAAGLPDGREEDANA